MDSFRWVSIGLVVALILVGPLSAVGWAQQPKVLYEETIKAAEAPAPAKLPDTAYQVGAIVVNVVHIPGKTALCLLSTGVGLAALAATLGTGYRTTAWIMEEGCGGPWMVTARDLKGAAQTDGK